MYSRKIIKQIYRYIIERMYYNNNNFTKVNCTFQNKVNMIELLFHFQNQLSKLKKSTIINEYVIRVIFRI